MNKKLLKWICAISGYSPKNLMRLPLQHFCEVTGRVSNLESSAHALISYPAVLDWVIVFRLYTNFIS